MGLAFEFVRNTILNDTPWGAPVNPFNPSQKVDQPLHRNQFGGTIGGPIRKDKTFFFFSYAGLPANLRSAGDWRRGAYSPGASGRFHAVAGGAVSASHMRGSTMFSRHVPEEHHAV